MARLFDCTLVVLSLSVVAGCGSEPDWFADMTLDGAPVAVGRGGCSRGEHVPEGGVAEPWLTCVVRTSEWYLEASVWGSTEPGTYATGTSLPFDCDLERVSNVMLRHWIIETRMVDGQEVEEEVHDARFGSCGTQFAATVEILSVDEDDGVEGRVSTATLLQPDPDRACACGPGGTTHDAGLEFHLPLGRMASL